MLTVLLRLKWVGLATTGLILATLPLPVMAAESPATPETHSAKPIADVPLNAKSAIAESSLPTPSVQTLSASSPGSGAMDQVTSVSQLSDVQPSDWAYQSLQSLVERYGCIVGYPDQTYRGNRAMTRYEFAAGLNACLDRINELIAASTADLATKEDLATLQRLQEEFAAELATLRGRVDSLESRTAFLEATQFSTTTKLTGQVIMAGIGATGGAEDQDDPNIILVDRVRLNFNTSFNGKDLLITGLQAYNMGGGDQSIGGALGLADPLGLSASNARLSFEPQFPGVDPKTLRATGNNDIELYKLLYIRPFNDQFTGFVGTAAEVSDAFPAITPFADEGQESISRFASMNPVLRVSGGTSGTGLASAAGFIWKFSEQADLRALYGSVNANIPENEGFPATPLGAGVFSGSYVAAAQLTLHPSKTLDIGLNYAHSYHDINILGTGLSSEDIGVIPGISATSPVNVNSVGGTLTWNISPKVAFSSFGSFFFVDGADRDAGTTLSSWMAGFHFRDLFQEGNTAGLIFGQPLNRIAFSGDAEEPDDRATPYHLEAYYKHKINDHISLTPGGIVLFNPEGSDENETTFLGVLRTTFSF